MINAYNAVIEVTRKCNMTCSHCLRGEAQKKTISNQHISKFLSLFNSIGILTLSGGEPTLEMDTLNYIAEYIQHRDVNVENFFIVTNGKNIKTDILAEWIKKMYILCGDNELSGVGFSFDRFHALTELQMKKRQNSFYRLSENVEYSIGKNIVTKHTGEKFSYHNLLSEGRAKDNGGCRENYISEIETEFYGDIFQISEGTIYLSATGYIINGCDYSFDRIDNDKSIRICHIDEIVTYDDLIFAIKKYNKRFKQGKMSLTEEELFSIY